MSDYSNIIGSMFSPAAAVGNLDAEPDKAARAVGLEQSTGVPASTIYGDVETFEAQHKAALTRELFRNNPQLGQYANSNPMAAKVSADDWGALDAVSSKLEKLRAGSLTAPTSILSAAVKGFGEGFGPEAAGAWALRTDADQQFAKQNPLATAAWQSLGLPLELFTRAFSGAIEAIGAGVEEGYRQFGGTPSEAERFAREAKGMAEFHAMGGSGVHVELPPEHIMEAHRLIQAAKPYILAGKEPPVGVHELIDKAHAEQAKLDVKNLDETLAEAVSSATRERDPEGFRNFIRQHTEAKIGISADAVRKLYGDAEPALEDGKLGWVPDLVQQLRTAEAVGGDVEVPLADWLARVDPEIAKELHDDLRVRGNGLTLNEAKELPKPKAAEAEKTPEQLEDEAMDRALREERAAPAKELPPEESDAAIDETLAEIRKQRAIDTVRKASALTPMAEAESTQARLAKIKEAKERYGEWYDFGQGVTARLSDWYTENEQKFSQAIAEELGRIVPQAAEVYVAKQLQLKGTRIQGVYNQYWDQLPIIIVALDVHDPVGIARHEALHHLRAYGFIEDAEWTTLLKAAKDNDWIKRYDIHERYAGQPEEAQLEEAIADRLKDWRRNIDLDEPDVKGPVRSTFKKLKDFLDAIRLRLSSLLGHEPTWQDIFDKIETGEVGARTPEPRIPGVFKPKPAEGDIFDKASALGMTRDQYLRYQRLIQRRQAEDLEAQLEKAKKQAKTEQTKTWKENFARTRDEVEKDLRERPNFQADEFFREGTLYGEKLSKRPKLDEAALTDEQKASLRSTFYGSNGIHPDDAAGLFGYPSGDYMISRLAEIERNRTAAKLTAPEYFDFAVNQETRSRMEREYGDLDENILREAQEHVVSETQMDLLHEEVVALGIQTGSAMPFTKTDFKAWVKKAFDESNVSQVGLEKSLREAGKAGRNAEMALLKNDPGEAFKEKQRQYMSLLQADQAKKLEKERTSFDKTAKRMAKREVPSVEQEYTNWVHDILQRVGEPIRRSIQDLQQSLGGKTLEEFVAEKESAFREIPVADFLLDQGFRKRVDDMSVAEFRAVHDSIKALVRNGRDEKKIYREGEEADLDQVKAQMIGQLETFPKKDLTGLDTRLTKAMKAIRTFGAKHLQLESLFNRWDRGDPDGVFTQYVIRDLANSANYEAKLERKYANRIRALGDKVDLNERVQNNLFKVPGTDDFLVMNRGKLRAVLQNIGNASNLDKLARGYKVEPTRIMDWLFRNATKADWDWAQKQGDIFADIKREADVMYRNLTGIEPENIEIQPIMSPHGTYRGWYHPVVYDKTFEGSSQKLMGRNPLQDNAYVRATTPRGYTIRRSNYVAPLELSLDGTANLIRSMLHDISFRPAIINASKIFYDKDVRSAITHHYGEVYRDLLDPYLQDVANSANRGNANSAWASKFLEGTRQNVIATLIGLNPGTVLKHGTTALVNSMNEVGAKNFLKATMSLFSVDDRTGERNYRFAMDTSEELQRRHRHYFETLKGAQTETLGKMTWRETVQHFGAWPVAMSDLASAVPTWLARYETAMGEGRSHGDAVFLADRAVRRAHGSSVITNRAAIMQGGPGSSWFTSLYGFFSHILNRQYEMAWKAGETLGKVKAGDWKDAAKDVPGMASSLVAYVFWPALIEELVTPMTNDEKESWAKKVTKAVGFSLSSSWVGIRDVVHAMATGHDPSAGLVSTALKTVTDLQRDLTKEKMSFTKQNAGHLIQHAATAAGAATGLVNAQEGKVARFGYGVATNQERPKGPWGWAVGLRYGTLKGHSATLSDWFKGKVSR